jgi:SnoaL-like domain
VDTETAARRWIDAWSRAWRQLDAELLDPIYAPDAVFRSHPFRQPQNPIEYARWALSEEEGPPELWMGEPLVSADRATIEWWAAIVEKGKPITLAGASIVRFGGDGRVVEQHDYWGQAEGRVPPWDGWGDPAS